MNTPSVTTIQDDQKDALIDVLMLAFSNDPLARYGFVDASQYLAGMRLLFEAMIKPSAEGKGAWLSEGNRAGAIWLAPGTHAEDDDMAAMASFVEPSRAASMFELLGQMGASHPAEPHWYLNFIGVDNTFQGQGLGSAVLKASLQPIDEQGLTAYLESSNPANVPLYERFGFEVTGELQVKDSPVIYPMVRAKRLKG